MIAKVCKRGANATGIVRYLTSDRKDAHVIIEAPDIERLNAPSSIRPDISKPIWHAALSLPEGESLPAEQWHKLAADFLSRMGLEGHEWAGVVHNETNHQHAHIVANRISWTGTVWSGEWDGKRAIAAAKELEKLYGLTVDEHRPTGRAALTHSEIEKAIRTQTQPARLTLQEIIDRAAISRAPIENFLQTLEAQGVRVTPHIASTGRVSGLAFTYNGETFKGSQLGKAYAWSKLQQRIGYEQDRDAQALQARRHGSGEGIRPDAGRPDSGRVGRIGNLDARHGGATNGSLDDNRTGSSGILKDGQGSSRERKKSGRTDSTVGERLGPSNRPAGTETGRTVSAITSNRRPVRGSRQRISKLVVALLARLEEQQKPEHSASNNRHVPSSTRTDDRVNEAKGCER